MESKFFLKSKAIIGFIILAIPPVANIFGFDLSDDQISAINTSLTDLLDLIGSGLIVYGLRDSIGGGLTLRR